MTDRPTVITTIAGIREAVGGAETVALVPTMGALHDGHLAHARRALELAGLVVVSIFVNPTQFGPGEDLDRYPRTLDADLDRLAGVADIVFAPDADELYPHGPTATRVVSGEVGGLFEGRSRPGHFDGVLTVVAKLLNIVRPDVVTFGQKDAQQLFLVQRMVRDLDIPTRVEVIPTVREPDGLALSSRNRFLDVKERRGSLALSRALEAAQSSADRGVDAASAAAQAALMGEPLVQLDYFAIVDPATFLPVADGFHGRALALVAARLGTTRLIDNALLVLG